MKKKMTFIGVMLTIIVFAVSCSHNELLNEPEAEGDNGDGNGETDISSTYELTSFTIGIDKSSAEPTNSAEAYYPEDEDDITQNSFGTSVNINFDTASVDDIEGVTVTKNSSHIVVDHGDTKGICYVLSGKTEAGSLTVLGNKKYALKLNGASITNPDSSAINLLSKKRAYIILADGTSNTLKDAIDSKSADHKATFYGKGKMLFSGGGSLEVYANYKNGIQCADYIVFGKGNNIYVNSSKNHGIKANDGLFINGGIINVEVSASAAKGINCESHIVVNGGRTTVITTGNGTYDTDDLEAKGSAGIKTDSTFTINGGEVWLKSTGSGGKGIKADDKAYFNNGCVYIITEGGQFSKNGDTASPKGIKVDDDLYIKGGTIMVRTSGKNGEGIESKKNLTISGGQTAVCAYDDAINSAGTMTISDGYLFAWGKNNDGIDANGNLYIKGGFVYAVGATQPEVAIDANTEDGYKLYVQGGTIIAIGGLERGSALTQSCYSTSSWSKNSWYSLSYGNTTVAFKTPSAGGNTMVVSASSQPTLTNGVSVTAGTSCLGGMAVVKCSVSGGNNVSLSPYTGDNSGGPGWRPGGR